MAKREDVLTAMHLFETTRPQRAFEEMSKQAMGSFAVLRYLSETDGDITSATISKALNISSARMAVLLKKLDAKELITRAHSPNDARAIALKLSAKGEAFVDMQNDRMYDITEKIVDELGLDEIKKLLKNLTKMKKIIAENLPCDLEEHND